MKVVFSVSIKLAHINKKIIEMNNIEKVTTLGTQDTGLGTQDTG